jgi:ribosomal 50S subunit-recycling heat shock protein
VRLDFYLKVTRLVPRRSGAGDLCREGMVEVNGQPGKPGRQVQPGDRIRVRFLSREIVVEVIGLPVKKTVSKVTARTFYTVLEEKRFDMWGREVAPKPPDRGARDQ